MVRSFVRPAGGGGDSFSSLWTAFTLTVHINALYTWKGRTCNLS